MKIMYDWEFLERYGTVQGISAGFVRQDGKELYFVLNDFNTLAVAKDDWLMTNVMSSIKHAKYVSHQSFNGVPVMDFEILDSHAMSRAEARQELMEFTSDIWPDFWAWYGAYDHVCLCSLFGSMVDLPKGWPMFTQDLKQLHKTLGSPELPPQPEGVHNALEDARYNWVRYDFMKKYQADLDSARIKGILDREKGLG